MQVDDHRYNCVCVDVVDRLHQRYAGVQVDLALDPNEDVARWLVRDLDVSHPVYPSMCGAYRHADRHSVISPGLTA